MIKRIFLPLSVSLICSSPYLHADAALALQNNANASLSRIEQEILHKHVSKASLAELINIVDRYPSNSRAHILLGNCCDSMGLPEQAMQQYKLAFKYGPNDAQSVLELVKAQVRAGQLSAASSLLKEAMERFPANPQILFWTGNALFKERRFEEAKQLYLQAINKSPKRILGINSALGNLSLMDDRFNNALSLALIDLASDPDFPLANEVAGKAMMKMGRFEGALPYLATAHRSDPGNYTLAAEYTRCLIWCGKYDLALSPVLYALADAPNYIERGAMVKLIRMIGDHLCKRTVEDCIEQVNHSRVLDKNLFVRLQLGKICQRLNMPQEAIRQTSLAVQLDPTSAATKYSLALMYENYGHDYVAALQSLREARTLEPYNAEINQHLMRLEDRLTNNKADWAWRFKDWLGKKFAQTANHLS